MKQFRKWFLLLASLVFLLITFATLVGGTESPKANLSATCFCKISKDDLQGVVHATGVIKDLTGEVNTSFLWQGSGQQDTCQSICSLRIQNYYVKNSSILALACAANFADGLYSVYGYSAVGTMSYRRAGQVGTLAAIAQRTATTCTCPATWACNGCSPQVPGGVTTDGKCKKWAGTNTITPYPPNGTQLGSWGFTWGNAFVAWGTSANGGAPTCITTVTQLASCAWF